MHYQLKKKTNYHDKKGTLISFLRSRKERQKASKAKETPPKGRDTLLGSHTALIKIIKLTNLLREKDSTNKQHHTHRLTNKWGHDHTE